MRKLREVLRLHYTADLSIRQSSVGSIQNILKLAKQHGLDWSLPGELDDRALALKLFPQSDAKPSSKLKQGERTLSKKYS